MRAAHVFVEIAENIQVLYPLVASLSDGQRAGAEFISLRELVMLSNRDAEYSDEDLEDFEATSVYEGVDRAIYEKGGVGLTTDARRADALERQKNAADRRLLSTSTIVMYAMTGAAALGFLASLSAHVVFRVKLKSATAALKDANEKVRESLFDTADEFAFAETGIDADNKQQIVDGLAASSRTSAWMSVGFAVAMVIMAASPCT